MNDDDKTLTDYVVELNNYGVSAPRLSEINNKYPWLVSAIEYGVKINENITVVKAILERLLNDPHCPCRITRDKSTECMCEEFRNMIDNNVKTACHCRLFVNN